MAEHEPDWPPWTEHMQTQLMSDGVTVWINNKVGSIGRFGLRGIDVHTADTTGCLYCTHGYTRRQDWDVFVEKMLENHGVVVDQKHRPVRFA